VLLQDFAKMYIYQSKNQNRCKQNPITQNHSIRKGRSEYVYVESEHNNQVDVS